MPSVNGLLGMRTGFVENKMSEFHLLPTHAMDLALNSCFGSWFAYLITTKL